jgi:hypothetical protein
MKAGVKGPGELKGLHIRNVAKTLLQLEGVEPSEKIGGKAFDLGGL